MSETTVVARWAITPREQGLERRGGARAAENADERHRDDLIGHRHERRRELADHLAQLSRLFGDPVLGLGVEPHLLFGLATLGDVDADGLELGVEPPFAERRAVGPM